MDKEKLEELKIQMQQLLNEAEEFINNVPPIQLYTAIGVVLVTLFLLLISKLFEFSLFRVTYFILFLLSCCLVCMGIQNRLSKIGVLKLTLMCLIPPVQFYMAVGVVLVTLFLLLISKLFEFLLVRVRDFILFCWCFSLVFHG